MIFKVENLKIKGYFTRIYNKRIKTYNELIANHQSVLQVHKALYDSEDTSSEVELFNKPISNLSKEEKLRLYKRAKENCDITLRTQRRYLKEFKDLTDEDFSHFRRDLSIYEKVTFNEDISLDILYEEEFIKNLTDAKNSTYIFSLDKDELNPTNVLYFKLYAKKLWAEGRQVRFVICQDMLNQSNEDRINYTYTKEELEMLFELDNYIKDNGGEGVLFREFLGIENEEDLDNAWTFNEVMYVNNNLDRIVNVIKKNNYTPFETMIYLHKYFTTHFFYNKGELEESRILPGIFHNTKIVCSGYTSLLKAVVDRLDDENLKAQIMGCKLFDNKPPFKQNSAHCQNLVYLKDEKYDIDGYYVMDLTYDCKKLFNGNKEDGGFAHCLLPLNALMHYREYIYANFNDKNRYHNLMRNAKEIKGIKEDYVPFVVRKYGDKSEVIDESKYRSAIGKVFAGSIKKGTLNIDEEIEKSTRKTQSYYTSEADVNFTTPESRLLKAIFDRKKRRKSK